MGRFLCSPRQGLRVGLELRLRAVALANLAGTAFGQVVLPMG